MNDPTAILVGCTVFFVQEFVKHHKVEDKAGHIRMIKRGGDHDLIMAGEIMPKDAGGGAVAPAKLRGVELVVKESMIDAQKTFAKMMMLSARRGGRLGQKSFKRQLDILVVFVIGIGSNHLFLCGICVRKGGTKDGIP